MELLAPAGNWDMLRSAVYSGANAVYLGLNEFNARIKADNFNTDNISEVTTFCHLHNVKVYVVINTSVKDNEKSRLKDYIVACNEASIDAFIVSDIGIIKYFNMYAPSIPLHASTQLAIHNVEGARIVNKLGFSRIVVARETLLSDIIKIKDELDVEIEYFMHGALCVAFSGNCLLSSIISGNSGNRGRCLQPCRLKYTSSLGDKTGYLLSPKDQCLINNLDALKNAGVDSLKIEGRLKSRNYVTSVVKSYRYALDNNKVDKGLYNDMLMAFNRGEFTKGYNFDATKGIMNPKVQGNIGLSIGKIVNTGKGYFEVKTNYPLKDKMGLKILSNTGEELGGFMINGIKSSKNGYIIYSNAFYKVGSDVRITSSEDIEPQKTRIDIEYNVEENDNNLSITASCNGASASISKSFDKAIKRSTTKDDINASLYKINDTEFAVKSINISYNNDLFIVKSELNAMRREVIDKLIGEMLFNYNISKTERVISDIGDIINNTNKLNYNLTVEIENEYMVTDYISNNANIVINVPEICFDSIQSIINKALNYNKNAELLIKLPNVARGKDIDNIYNVLDSLSGYTGIYADNLYAIDIANKYNIKVFGGQLLNLYNIDAVNLLGLTNYMISTELNTGEMSEFDSDAYVFSFGYLPLMTLTHCPVQLNTGCMCSQCMYRGVFTYSDNKETFNIRRTKNINCIFTLFNSKLHNILEKIGKIKYNNYINLVNIDDDYDKIVKAYIDKNNTLYYDNHTYGHLFRGVK